MAPTDWLLLAIVALSALLGLVRGFVGVAASLAAWVLASWAAFRFGGEVALLLAPSGVPSVGQTFAGYALCFVAVSVAVALVAWLVRLAVNSVGLSGVDRVLGLGLGLVRGVFVACAIVLLLGMTSMPREPQWRQSAVIPYFVGGAQLMRTWLPDWAAARVDFSGRGPMPGTLTDSLPELPAPAGA